LTNMGNSASAFRARLQKVLLQRRQSNHVYARYSDPEVVTKSLLN
jgi:hypothetical protein